LIDLSVSQRQSPLAVVFLAISAVRRIGLVQLGVLAGVVAARSPSLVIFALIIATVGLLLVGVAALQWWRYTFGVVNGELLVQRGVLSQQRLTIPLDRVQSVSIGQRWLHRPFSLVQVAVDTAGTGAAEFTIDAIAKPAALALQRVVAHDETVDIPVAEEVLVRHSAGRLVRVGLTQMPLAGLVLVAPLLSVGDELLANLSIDLPQPNVGRLGLLAVSALVVGGLTFVVLLNVARVLLTDWNLTVTNTPEGIRRSAGLLSTTSVVSSVPRIQRFTVRQTLLERLQGFHTVILNTIGANSIGMTGCDEDQVAALRAVAMAESTAVEVLDRPVSTKVVFLHTRNTAVVAAVMAATLWFVVSWWALVAFIPVAFVGLSTRRRSRLRRWGLVHDAVADRRQFIGWRHQDILLRKVNGTQIRQTLFERKRGLATIKLSTATGAISIGMIPLDDAKGIRDRALFVAETDQRPWM